MNLLKKHAVGVHLSKQQKPELLFQAAEELGINVFACFTASPMRLNIASEIEKTHKEIFIKKKHEGGYRIFSHASYLINIADTEKNTIYENSIKSLTAEIDRCNELDIEAIAFHPGSNPNRIKGLETIAMTINNISSLNSSHTQLCIESSAGQGNTLPTTLEEMAYLDSLILNKKKVGFVLDTCHLFAAGYDLSNPDSVLQIIENIEKTIGFSRIMFLHLNDSQHDVGSHRDRHETLAKGKIGLAGIEYFLRHPNITLLPKILETPVNAYHEWKPELALIKKIYSE
jgi:deoxyribonuclease-4